MIKNLLSISILLVITFRVNAQNVMYQYFDGADTIPANSIIVQLDTSSSNIWQIGPPQKIIFNAAATVPNVIVTDTINNYPVNNTSQFMFEVIPQWFGNGILAVQWKQKLDLDTGRDGGIVEYSIDHGATYHNVFNDPNIFNFYGYDPNNADTLTTGEYVFSGTDTTWKDIWLCFNNTFMVNQDTVWMRYTLKTDSIPNNKEGWMIDNMMTHITIMHTTRGNVQEDYMKVFPNITDGIVNFQAQKSNELHPIENVELYSADGRLLQTYGNIPPKYTIDIGNRPNGMYFFRVRTNMMVISYPIVLDKK